VIRHARVAALGLAAAASVSLSSLAGCDAGKTESIGFDTFALACNVAPNAPPQSLGLPGFYQKYLDAHGIPVVSSGAVADAALVQACLAALHMVDKRDDVRQAMIADGMHVAVIGTGEVTTDIPEYRDLYSAFPGIDWDQDRGVGATIQRPVSSAGEENLLCLAGDPHAGESVTIQTFSSSVLLGLEAVERSYDNRLQDALTSAMSEGKWANTFAEMNTIAYFGEGVQDWFDANRQADPPDGIDNFVNTREELQQYDPTLAGLVAEVMPDTPWHPVCP
jgi:alpha-glucosidase